MELYTFFNSSAAYRVRIALQLKGLHAQQHAVNLSLGEHEQPWYRAVAPVTLVPTLVEDGRALSQSLAILEYLDERHPLPTARTYHDSPPEHISRTGRSPTCSIQGK